MPTKKAKKATKKAVKRKSVKSVKYSYDFGQKTDGSSKLGSYSAVKVPISQRWPASASPSLLVSPSRLTSAPTSTTTVAGIPKHLLVKLKLPSLKSKKSAKSGQPKTLLLSVRSGARESMPGMMDTILNLGLNDKTVKALAKESGNAAFAYDCYRRFIQMYGDVVMGVQALNENDHCPFEGILEKVRKEAGVELDNELTSKDLKELIKRTKQSSKTYWCRFSPRCLRATLGFCERRVQLMAERASNTLPPQIRHPCCLGYGC